MALIAPVENGKVVDTSKSSSSIETKPNDSLDKNAFLQLLVAEMQNQDPLEPTTNTEYISQLATFSSLEEMQNVSKSMDFYRASSLVGQEVYIRTSNGVSGDTTYVHGNVDYISYENGKPYVHVNGNSYPLADVDSVYDSNYTSAYDKAYNWTVGLNKIPSVSRLDLSYEQKVYELFDELGLMSEYEKSFVTKENQNRVKELADKMDSLVVSNWSSKLNALPTVEEMSASDKKTLNDLKKQYDKFSSDQKNKVSDKDVEKLNKLISGGSASEDKKTEEVKEETKEEVTKPEDKPAPARAVADSPVYSPSDDDDEYLDGTLLSRILEEVVGDAIIIPEEDKEKEEDKVNFETGSDDNIPEDIMEEIADIKEDE